MGEIIDTIALATMYHEQRDEAARLYWKMRHDRDGYKELLANEWTAHTETWRKLVHVKVEKAQANAMVVHARAERDKWKADAVQCAKEASQYSSEATYAEVMREMENAAANARIAELEAQLAERDERKCETCQFIHLLDGITLCNMWRGGGATTPHGYCHMWRGSES